jgi:hypothetical protein
MKTKFNNSELTHVWANQTQTHGKGSNMFFEHDSIYSYGYHFKLAQHITNKQGEKCVFFNDRHYSNSTSKQQALVWRSIPANVQFFKVQSFFNDIETSTTAHLENLKSYLEYAKGSQQKTIYATKLKNGYINQTKIAIDVFDKYVKFFDLAQLLWDYPTLQNKYAELNNWLFDYQESKEFKQWQIKQEENKKKAEAKAIIDAKEKIEAFRQFKISSIYANLGHYLLRYNKETDNVETSGGVKMSKNVFLLAYQRLKNNTLQIGQHVGDFTYNGIKDGFLSVGCHKISIDEVENLIPELG